MLELALFIIGIALAPLAAFVAFTVLYALRYVIAFGAGLAAITFVFFVDEQNAKASRLRAEQDGTAGLTRVEKLDLKAPTSGSVLRPTRLIVSTGPTTS